MIERAHLIHVEGRGGLVKARVHQERAGRERRGEPRAQEEGALQQVPSPLVVPPHSLQQHRIIALHIRPRQNFSPRDYERRHSAHSFQWQDTDV